MEQKASSLIFSIATLALSMPAWGLGSSRTDLIEFDSVKVRIPLKLQIEKKKLVFLKAPRDLEALRIKKDELTLTVAGQKVLFQLPSKIKVDDGIPKELESLGAPASTTGQNVGVAIKRLDIDSDSSEYPSTESCSSTRYRTVCDGVGANRVCREESVTTYGTREVIVHSSTYTTTYALNLTDSAEQTAVETIFHTVANYSYTSGRGPCIPGTDDRWEPGYPRAYPPRAPAYPLYPR